MRRSGEPADSVRPDGDTFWLSCYGLAMNSPFRPGPPSPNRLPTYEEDPYAWAMSQARLLRERMIDDVDWDNVAEEIESVGRSERRSLSSNLVQLLLHMMKWEAQPERRGRSWLASISNHRAAALEDLADNPSLKASVDTLFAAALKDARRRAAVETGEPRAIFDALSFTLEDAFEREYETPDY